MQAEIMVLKIPQNITSNDYRQLLSLVSEEKRIKISQLRQQCDVYRTLFGEVLVRAAIVRILDLPNQEIQFTYNSYGKPSLIGNESFHFNISHAGDWVALFISSSPVGIDVEQICEIDESIAKSYFSKMEYERLFCLRGEERTAYFYELWTLKESYIKAKGKGLSIPLDSFSIHIGEDSSIALTPRTEAYFFKQYELNRSYKLAACTTAPEGFPNQLQHWRMEDLIHLFF